MTSSGPAGSQRPARARIRVPAAVWALGFVSLLMDISSELIHSLLPVFLVTTLGASALAVGLIEGVAEGTALVFKVFSGALSDYWGRRKPLALLGYGLGALSKPLFALAPSTAWVFAARLTDRIGKGIRGAPLDALVADVAPAAVRGAAFGLRQALDTVGAFLGPLMALGLMVLWNDDFRAVFRVAIVPGLLAVALLAVGVREPRNASARAVDHPFARATLGRLPRRYWWVLAIGAAFTLARFSEAFLILRANQGGLPLSLTPLVLIGMNVVFAASAYPLGKLSDRTSHSTLLACGLAVLIVADLLLARSAEPAFVWSGIALWGLHMGITQGLLATMVADAAPADLRGTAFGFFNLACGVALLLSSGIAGLLWDGLGAPATFLAGAGISVLALVAVVVQARIR
jgi:MFS family permease